VLKCTYTYKATGVGSNNIPRLQFTVETLKRLVVGCSSNWFTLRIQRLPLREVSILLLHLALSSPDIALVFTPYMLLEKVERASQTVQPFVEGNAEQFVSLRPQSGLCYEGNARKWRVRLDLFIWLYPSSWLLALSPQYVFESSSGDDKKNVSVEPQWSTLMPSIPERNKDPPTL
jgi:hypothetical protein